MTAKMTAARKPFRSGFCGLGNPQSSHEHCRGAYGDQPCVCACHRPALVLDEEERAELAALAAEVDAAPEVNVERVHACADCGLLHRPPGTGS